MSESRKDAISGKHPPETERLMRRASVASLAVGLTLTLLKLAVWSVSGSLSLFASMFDSLFDVVASLINLLAIHFALQPPDKEHRFGHGKIEDVAALTQAAFIAGSGLFICVQSIQRFFNPAPVEREGWGLAVMAVSIVLTVALVTYQRHVVRKTDSIAVRSDSFHYFTDLVTNIAVVIALVLSAQFDYGWADPLFALGIAAYIFWGACRIGNHAFQNLLDREFEEEERRKIMEICRGHPNVKGMHDLRTRRSGIYNFIQCHLVFAADISLKEANRITHEVEAKLKEAFPNLEVLIHEDPENAVPQDSAAWNHDLHDHEG
jgi:ferrous-iron efflux pump FieF